jgi:hypothetical protein
LKEARKSSANKKVGKPLLCQMSKQPILSFIFQVQYLERAEKLKTYLNGKNKKKPVKEGGSGETKKGADKVKINILQCGY